MRGGCPEKAENKIPDKKSIPSRGQSGGQRVPCGRSVEGESRRDEGRKFSVCQIVSVLVAYCSDHYNSQSWARGASALASPCQYPSSPISKEFRELVGYAEFSSLACLSGRTVPLRCSPEAHGHLQGLCQELGCV